MAKIVDLAVIYWFIKILTKPWEDQDAFKLGIIDINGQVLRKEATLQTKEEKAAYTLFHRLIFNIKKLLEKLPGGKMRIASFALGLYLLREEAAKRMEDPQELINACVGHIKTSGHAWQDFLNEQFQDIQESRRIDAGTYIYEETGKQIVVPEDIEPIDVILGIPIYRSGETVFTENEIRRAS